MSESLLAATSEIELVDIPETQKIFSQLPWSSSKTFPNGEYTYTGHGIVHTLTIEDNNQVGFEKLEFEDSFALLRTAKNGKDSLSQSQNIWLLITPKPSEEEEEEKEEGSETGEDKEEGEEDAQEEETEDQNQENEEEDEEEGEDMEEEDGQEEEEAEDQDQDNDEEEDGEDMEATTLSERLLQQLNKASKAIETQKNGVFSKMESALQGDEFQELEGVFAETDFKHLILVQGVKFESLASSVQSLSSDIFEKNCFIFSKEDTEYTIAFTVPNKNDNTTQLYSYGDNGHLKSSNIFTKGQLNGLQTSYHSNGKIAEEVTFEEGVECLDKKTFHEDGTLNRTTLLLEESEVVQISNFDEQQRQTKSSLWRFEEEAEDKECVSFGYFGDVQIASDWKPEQDEGRYLTSVSSARGYLGKREAFAEGLFEADGIDYDNEAEEETEEGVDFFEKNIDSIYSLTSKEKKRIEFFASNSKRLVLLADKEGRFKKIKYE